jgi:hypothetical protein
MSLINDALKKAQRQRTNNPFGIDAPVPGGGGRSARRGNGMPTQTIMLIVAGCALLVVLSGVGAVLFVNRKPAPSSKPAPSVAASSPVSTAPAASTTTDFPTLTITPIVIPPRNEAAPASSANPPSSPLTTEKQPDPAPVATVAKAIVPEEKTVAAAKAPPAAAPDPAVLQEKIHTYLDTLRIAGVRAAGAGSRVLLNEKVYRVNEIVDRNLGLKLTAVESEYLKFTGPNGVEYQKNF